MHRDALRLLHHYGEGANKIEFCHRFATPRLSKREGSVYGLGTGRTSARRLTRSVENVASALLLWRAYVSHFLRGASIAFTPLGLSRLCLACVTDLGNYMCVVRLPEITVGMHRLLVFTGAASYLCGYDTHGRRRSNRGSHIRQERLYFFVPCLISYFSGKTKMKRQLPYHRNYSYWG